MSAIFEYVRSGDWTQLYEESERGVAVGFLYNLLNWLERDKADQLVLHPNKIQWLRKGEVLDTFLLTIPFPTPSFGELLALMISRDTLVANILTPLNKENTNFSVNTHLLSS